MEAGGGPPANWYDDPHGSGLLRWWDGAGWTEHTHAKPEVAAAAQAPVLSPAPAGGRAGPSVWVWAACALALVLTIGGLIALLAGSDGGTDGSSDPLEADAQAQAEARTAQAAMETWATDNNGEYTGGDPETLAGIEPSLPLNRLLTTSEGQIYTITVTSESGGAFTVTRTEDGLTTFTCSPEGQNGCPAGGDWSGS